ncbi:hypothetical protein BTO06_14470 [Tenacibaculum sp. SZ-18]|uniref:glycosyltransferase family 9 protein n=1 Tax=Tenacibaculum sp. SZ-18 TaxID=754423 RepID=UPI000C2D53E6|nr:glycosyltransferase family 9 protein [Tenacibaculum sp. SZ-18]AUC16278.1 hypothetical protein BTO06_14470 [Tenacibaculum sp. SZ-18]
MMSKESLYSKPWKSKKTPKKILLIRYQALGDVFFTFPYISDLKSRYPEASFDLIVRKQYSDLPFKMKMFRGVYTVKRSESKWTRILSFVKVRLKLLFKRYDIVIDLQRNHYSRFIRKTFFPKAFTELERFSPKLASERYKEAIERLQLGTSQMDFSFAKDYPKDPNMIQLLLDNGWKKNNKLILLNPAGAFVTRNWSIDNYVALIEKWSNNNPNSQFVILGIDRIKSKAEEIQRRGGEKVINLVGKTNVSQAYSIVLMCDLTLTEDSGLGHFSWLSYIPTLTMLGSTRSDNSAPIGAHTYFFDSSNLECGNCMLRECIHDEILCMEQIKVEDVYTEMQKLAENEI